MKPLRLWMRAFGPFAGEQAIDFRELGDRCFFLISGPTGAGKTTILDAISFALYGESSGALRQAHHFRSAHADPRDESEVIFDFALGPERYRVQRRPKQLRAKRRGQGTTEVASEATLWRRTACTSDQQEGVPLATQPSKVDEQVQRLLGFECAQFRQVVVLPQGEFRNFLVADSKTREQILEQLFEVAHFQGVQDALKAGAEAMERRYAGNAEERRLLLEQAGAESADALESLLLAAELEVESAAARTAEQGAESEAAQQGLDEARARAEKLRELALSERAWSALQEREPELERLRSLLQRAQRAAPLLPLANSAVEGEAEVERARREIETAEAALAEAVLACSRAARELDVQRAREPARKAAGEDLGRLRAWIERSGGLEEARKKAQAASAAREAQAKLAGEAQRALELLRGARAGAVQGEAELRLEVAALTRAEQMEREARTRLAKWKRRGELMALLRELADERQRMETAQQACKQVSARASAESGRRRDAARSGRAVLLARELVTGEPCPVCGSIEHPAAAVPPHDAEAEIPDDAAIAAAEERERAAAVALGDAERELGLLREREVGLEAERGGLERDLAESLAAPIAALTDTAGEVFREALTRAGAALARATEARAELAQLEPRLAELAHAERNAITVETSEREQLAVLEAAAQRARAELETRQDELPEVLRAPGALAAAVDAAEARRLELEQSLVAAERTSRELEEVRSRLAERVAGARRAHGLAAERATSAQQRLEQGLRAEGFASSKELREAALEPDERSRQQQALRQHEDARVLALQRVERAREAGSGIEAPDLAALEERLRAARAAAALVQQQLGALQGRRAQLQRWQQQVAKLGAEISGLEPHFAALGRIAQVAAGKNAENLTFQRFVLAAFLDEVLLLASQQLLEMSRGRYLLRRASEVADRRRSAGLDLVVFDGHSGSERPVATLSGGESFLAALALALGLADVVQRHAGGIRLESIFVDEGFGSLDSNSLDLAVRTLLDLQHGGRLVGVISHVSELQERIGTQLEVSAGRSGSRARFLLA